MSSSQSSKRLLYHPHQSAASSPSHQLFPQQVSPAGCTLHIHDRYGKTLSLHLIRVSRQNAVSLDLVIACALKHREFPIECRGEIAGLVGHEFLTETTRTFSTLVFTLASCALFIVRTHHSVLWTVCPLLRIKRRRSIS